MNSASSASLHSTPTLRETIAALANDLKKLHDTTTTTTKNLNLQLTLDIFERFVGKHEQRDARASISTPLSLSTAPQSADTGTCILGGDKDSESTVGNLLAREMRSLYMTYIAPVLKPQPSISSNALENFAEQTDLLNSFPEGPEVLEGADSTHHLTRIPQSTVALAGEEFHKLHLHFLQCLRRILPLYTPVRIVADWWELALKRVIWLNQSRHKGVIDEARDITVATLVAWQEDMDMRKTPPSLGPAKYVNGTEGNPSERAFVKVLTIEETDLPSCLLKSYLSASIQEHSFKSESAFSSICSSSNPVEPLPTETSIEQREFWTNQLEQILVAFGAAKPKAFFLLLGRYFIHARYRLPVLLLLNSFARRQDVHLYHITSTPLFLVLLESLSLDSDVTVLAAGVTLLLMVMPSACTSIPPLLPRLFAILTRFLCWDVQRELQKRDPREQTNTRSIPEGINHVSDYDCDQNENDESITRQQNAAMLRRPSVTQMTSTSAISSQTSYISSSAVSLTGTSEAHRETLDRRQWQILEDTQPQDSQNTLSPSPLGLFTILYGMFPCNLFRFLRSPRAYLDERTGCDANLAEILKKIAVKQAELDETVRTKSEPYLQLFTVHPHVLLYDDKTEIEDTSRWMRMEPGDIVACCTKLRLSSGNGEMKQPRNNIRKHTTHAHEEVAQSWSLNETLLDIDDAKWYQGGSTSAPHSSLMAIVQPVPLEQKHLDRVPLEADEGADLSSSVQSDDRRVQSKNLQIVDVHSILATHLALKSGNVMGEGTPKPTISAYDTFTGEHPLAYASEPVPRLHGTGVEKQNDLLRRQILLLHNELNFELFLKQQHMRHIGRLRRQHIMESALEAERQSMYSTHRALRSEVKLLRENLDQVRAEAQVSKAKQKRWEGELNTRLRALREERKALGEDMARMGEDLATSKESLESAIGQHEQANERVFLLENQVKILEPQAAKVAELEQRVKQLTEQLIVWQDDMELMADLERHVEVLLSRNRALEAEVEAERSAMEDSSWKDRGHGNEYDDLLARISGLEDDLHEQDQKNKDMMKQHATIVRELKNRANEAEERTAAAIKENWKLQSKLMDIEPSLERQQRITPTRSSKTPISTTASQPGTSSRIAPFSQVGSTSGFTIAPSIPTAALSSETGLEASGANKSTGVVVGVGMKLKDKKKHKSTKDRDKGKGRANDANDEGSQDVSTDQTTRSHHSSAGSSRTLSMKSTQIPVADKDKEKRKQQRDVVGYHQYHGM